MGWLMSEKLDGINSQHAPGVFPHGCELHCGRGGFERALSAFQRKAWGELTCTPHGVGAIVCESAQHLADELARVLALGGEGLVLARDGELRKLKPLLDDEARVTGYVDLGGLDTPAIHVDWHGVLFKLGLKGRLRQFPPAIGELVTFTYSGLTGKGIPRNASFYRVRPANS